jgi:hypothetical protein
MQKYEDGYDAFKKAHPISHKISDYLKTVEQDESQYFNTIQDSILTNTNSMNNNV